MRSSSSLLVALLSEPSLLTKLCLGGGEGLLTVERSAFRPFRSLLLETCRRAKSTDSFSSSVDSWFPSGRCIMCVGVVPPPRRIRDAAAPPPLQSSVPLSPLRSALDKWTRKAVILEDGGVRVGNGLGFLRMGCDEGRGGRRKGGRGSLCAFMMFSLFLFPSLLWGLVELATVHERKSQE